MSLVAINANSPYKVKVAQADDTLCFITDFDAEIFVTFERDDILQNGLVYQFGISNPKGVKSPRDPKVRETILAIVEEFFAKNLFQTWREEACWLVKLVHCCCA